MHQELVSAYRPPVGSPAQVPVVQLYRTDLERLNAPRQPVVTVPNILGSSPVPTGEVFILDFSFTASGTMVDMSVGSIAAESYTWGEAFTSGGLLVVNSAIEAPRCEPPAAPLLEMHSGRRSLREKAQEVMSDFERNYPW